ncbi:hypothetical protein VPH35_020337 [Triticum aestivum]
MDPSGQPPQRASRRRIRANNYSPPPPRLVASTTIPCSLGSGESQPPRSLFPLLRVKIDSEVTGACSLLISPSSSSCEVPNRPAPDACVVVYDVGVQHVEAGRRDAVVADLLQRLLFDPEITGDEHNQVSIEHTEKGKLGHARDVNPAIPMFLACYPRSDQYDGLH